MATSSSDDDSDDDPFGAQSPPLTEQIASILRRYPDGGQILKELIQNADDAGATEVRFLVDSREHPTDGLPNEHFKKYQGPALYAWNDATFKREDWDCLAKIERSEKEKEVLKVGRFGLGFLSVFHITDLPMIVSGKWVGIVDPHRQCIPAKDDTRPAGKKKKLGNFFKHEGHVACFDGIFDLSSAQTDYNATLFRFPLRQDGTGSKICNTAYNPDKVKENLFSSLQKEAPIILLFLKSITNISLHEWDSAASRPTFLFRIEVDAKSRQVMQKARGNCEQMAERYCPSSTQAELQLYTTTFLQTLPEEKPKEVHWLVLNAIGSDNVELNKLGMELKVLPWVGIAANLSNHVPLPGAECYRFSASAIAEPNALHHELKPILQKLHRSQVTLPLSNEDTGSISGQAFCFLPLPGCTALPVNIHGYFSVADNRRSIKWPAHDDKGKEAQWNHLLLRSLVAPAYAILLACRSSLIQYQGTLPALNTRHITDPYAAWPVHGEVKNQAIWSELVEPTLKLASEYPLLWTQADGGKWVKLSEAYFLPGSFQTSTRTAPPSLAIEVLIEASVPVVSFPNVLCETLQFYQTLNKLVLDREVTPSLVRQALKKHKQILSLKFAHSDQYSLFALLDYILSDDDHITFDDSHLVGIPLLPLMSKERPFCQFEASRQANPRYVFTSSVKDVLHFLQGVDVMTVSTDVPSGLQAKLVRIAQHGKLQLQLAKVDTICSTILKDSIFSWCKQREHTSVWRWTPGCNNHPPIRWISSVWNWLCSKSVDLSRLEGLPLIPQSLPHDCVHAVSLIEVTRSLHLITLPNLPHQIEPAMFRCILKQLGFMVVERSICFDHPKMSTYIPTLKPDLVAKQICSRSSDVDCVSVIHRFDCDQKHALRRYLSSDSISKTYYPCLKSLSIFKAGIGKSESKLVCLDPHKHILPPPDSALVALPTELHYPDYVLCREDRSSVKLIKALGISELSVDSFCIDHLIPFAQNCCALQPKSSDGDKIVMWLLSKQPFLSKNVTSCLKTSNIIRTFSDIHNLKSPTELYDPHCTTFQELFDSRTEPVFPAEQYNPCLGNLRELGLKTWNIEEFFSCIHSRACTVGTLLTDKHDENAALQRSKTLLKILLEHPQDKLWVAVCGIRFLFPQTTPPSLYPPNLQWYGQPPLRLEAAEGMCLPFRKNKFLVGSVKPFLSHQYNSPVISGNVAGRFWQLKPELVIQQLHVLVKAVETKQVVDTLSISQMVNGIYNYLYDHGKSFVEQSLPKTWIWWENECKFLSATSVVLKQPGGMDLEPYIFAISKNKHLSQFKDLFKQCNIKKVVRPEDVVQILVKLKATDESTLSDSELRMVLDILTWLCNEKYESHCNILIPTSDRRLLSPTQCTFDDRGWIKQKKDVSKFTFVHERVDADLAKYFEVKPLSAMIAPSEKLHLNYTLAGQHERVTQRIRHIVQDYETNIDIFKELIQNADDAGATEVKFLIDWRKHPSSSLFAEELKPWQGPSLLAFNNATFSDQDFQHICQVAGETKRSDPLKTGRFGVGFCAAYQVTDLPSFISRRYFTIFDPHTTYLGDRVSHRQPGMRINLIENQGDLKFYEDQFAPYQNIFGCNVFSLPEEGYNGTLFRFPFRNEETARGSEISRKIHTKRESERLEKALQSCATELLLFLKHVRRVSLFHLNERDRNPGDMKKVLSVHKTPLQSEHAAQCSDQNVRTGLIEQYLSNSKHQETKSSSFQIDVQRQSQECSSSQWLLCSTLQSSAASKLDGKKIGLVPFGEVAVSIEVATGGSLYIPKCVEGRIFCFLPLPIRSELQFHVSGFFDIGKDRRSLSATDDETFGSQWNKALGQDALTQAFAQLLALLASRANPQEMKDPKFKEGFLKAYYSLWNFKKADGLVPKALVASFKKYIMDTELKILWSEVNGGSWICPKEAILFPYTSKSQIYQDAINMMIQEGYKVVEPPFHVTEMIKRCLQEKHMQAVYTYQRFCEVVLFPKVSTVDPSLREKHLLYLLEKVGEDRDKYKWAEQLLQKSNCIPCQESSQLLPPNQLIDPTESHLRCLYSPDEGRFPIESLLKSSKARSGLRTLGMATYKLKISDFQERAMSVCKLTPPEATNRSHHILEYFERVYCSYFSQPYHDERKQVKETLWDIPFLLPSTKPEDVRIPWCTKPDYITPSETFHLKYQGLIFTQKPVIELPSTLTNANVVLGFLGVSQNIPTLELVIQQLQCLVSCFAGTQVDDATCAYLEKEKVTCTIYRHLEYTITSDSNGEAVDVIKQKLKELHFIWQDGHFLSVDQVFKLWHHQLHPYLCELSSENARFEKLFSCLGVQEQPSVQKLAEILKKISDDHGPEVSVSEDIVHFIEDIVKVLKSQLDIGKKCNEEIFLPDENRVMRPASQLAAEKIDCAVWLGESETYRTHFETGSGHFVYEGIPPRSAKALGAHSVLDAVLKDIEDERFLDGSDYGQHEDLCDRLNSILKKYPADESIFQEFIQNADDAQASEIVFVLDHRRNFQDRRLFGEGKKWAKLQHTPALCIFNNRKFSETDIQGITKLGRGGKDQLVDKIGKFGIGFNVAYHITDCPTFLSYGEGGVPEHFCVFDPTCEFVPKASRNRSPGRKWKVTSKHIDEFADQFEPFLADDLPRLSECGPNCLRNFATNGFVVFRLPLTRTPESRSPSLYPSTVFPCKSKLGGSMIFTTDTLSQLLKKLSSKAEDILLFLNHIQQISVFEITEDGKCIHNSTTTATIPALHVQTYKQFPSYSSECVQQIIEENVPDTKSTFHQVNVLHVERQCGEFGEFSMMRKTAWLVQRAVGSKLLNLDLLQCALQKGLKPVGGVAAQLSLDGQQYYIFCFLPLPLSSHLPVHVNGHFLVDDSRKHLEKIKHEGLSEWNEALATCVIAPAYVELVLKARRYLPKIDKYYDHLFPRKELSGQLGDLKLVEAFYKELLSRNPQVLMPQAFQTQWFHLKRGYFCIRFDCKDTKMVAFVSSDLKNVLVALGMPITKAPNWLYRCCSMVDDTFEQTARIEPERVIGHLQKVELSNSNKLLIKDNIQCLLMYCCKAYKPDRFRYVLQSVPLLLAASGSLKMTSQIYESRYMSLLPELEGDFIDPGLEHSPAGEMLLQCGVIVSLPVEIVAQCIKLPNTKVPIPLDSDAGPIVKLLWKYLVAVCRITKLPSYIQHYFQHKPIIPTVDQRLYPVCLCKAVISTQFGDPEVQSVMKKLGCPLLDANFQQEMQVLETLITSSSPENVIQCLLLQPTLNYEAQLGAEEVHAFIECVRKAKSIKESKVTLTLLRLRLFQTTDRSFVSLDSESSIFILPTGIPLDGIMDIQRHTNSIVLKCPSEYAQMFYNAVVPNYSEAVVAAPDFYERLVLPNLERLDDEAILKHLLFIHSNHEQSDEFQHVLEVLRTIPFIFLNGKRCMPSELYDARMDFFKEFYPSELPPTPWNSLKWLNFFRLLGLKTEITDSMWLSQAQEVAKTISESSVPLKTIIQRSRILLAALLDKISVTCCDEQTAESVDDQFITFIRNVSKVRFIRTPIPVHVKQVLAKIIPCMQKQQGQHVSFTCFEDSVFSADSDLAGLCKSVLPDECTAICSMPAVIRNELFIEFPLSTGTVIRNLCLLSEVVSTSCIQLQSASPSIKEVKKIFVAHYAFLNRKKLDPPALKPLQEKAFILQNPTDSSLNIILVKISQLTMSVPTNCYLEPFCYKVPQDLLRFNRFLTTLGIPELWDAAKYAQVLSSMDTELKNFGKELNRNDQYMKVAESAYNELIRCLRHGDTSLSTVQASLILLTEKNELQDSKELLYDDVPWYAERLPPRARTDFKFIRQPLPDDKGRTIPPSSLGVRLLSAVVSEKIHDDVKSPDFNCNEEELYALKKRPTHCPYKQKLLDTLTSNELFNGLCRMYWSENKSLPTQEFLEAVGRLPQLEIKCIAHVPLKTVLCQSGKSIPGTEFSGYFCHLEVQDDKECLYISPHIGDFSEDEFLKQLAFVARRMLHGEVKNDRHIMAMFQCDPHGIPRTLDTERVEPYNPSKARGITYHEVGDDVPLDELTPQDSLIILNFSAGELVLFHSDGILEYCEVVEVEHSHKVFEQSVQIRTQKRITSDDSGSSKEEVKWVSPLQLYKRLTPLQHVALFSRLTLTGVFATPVTLAEVPISDLVALHTWLRAIYQSAEVQRFSGLDISLISIRLIGHLHYQLVLQSRMQQLFTAAVMEIQRLVRCTELPFQTIDEDHQLGEKLETLRARFEQLCLDGEEVVEEEEEQESEEEGEREEEEEQEGGEEGEREEEVITTPSSTNTFADGNTESIYSKSRRAQSPKLQPVSGTPSPYSAPQPVPHSVAALPTHRLPRRFPTVPTRRGYRPPQPTRFQPVHQAPVQPPKPSTCIKSARIWLEQAKVDFRAAEFLLKSMGELNSTRMQVQDEASGISPPGGASNTENAKEISDTIAVAKQPEKPSNTEEPDETSSSQQQEETSNAGHQDETSSTEQQEDFDSEQSDGACHFPALVCFLCHETAEKCLKGVHYAFCGLRPDMVDSSHLVELLESLKRSPHSPGSLIPVFQDCVYLINEHENKSRLPNYQIPPCAPAAVYSHLDASEAFSATRKLLVELLKDEKLSDLLGSIGEIPKPKFISTLKSLAGTQGADHPETWDHMDEGTECIPMLLDPEFESEEYGRIAGRFLQTMPNADILKIERIQNKPLWMKYIQCSEHMLQFNDGILGEQMLFHGSRTTDPSDIYKGDSSFDMRFSNYGMWGKGNYFAVNASYSNSYAYHSKEGVKKMLVAWVLTGYSYCCGPHPYTKPPLRCGGGEGAIQRRYDSVSGVTGGSKVYITYENDRAYPAYLVSYR